MSAPFVFLPGWCVGRTPVAAAVNALGGSIVDLPGYGSAAPIDDFDAAIDAYAARLQPGTTLGGWSLGAQMALAIAARHPDKVGKLLLVAGTTSFVQRDGWPHAMPPAMLAEFAAGIAAGPGAARYVQGRRETNHRSTTTWLKRVMAGESPVAEQERLSPEDRAREALVLGLRRIEGVRRGDFAQKFGFDVEQLAGAALRDFIAHDLLAAEGDELKLTRAGLLVSDALWSRLLRT